MADYQRYSIVGACLVLAACVTVNVYFPAAAAEQAADEIIQDVYGSGSGAQKNKEKPADNKGSGQINTGGALNVSGKLLGIIVPTAQAQPPDITISTPGIAKLKASIEKPAPAPCALLPERCGRHDQRRPAERAGNIGGAC